MCPCTVRERAWPTVLAGLSAGPVLGVCVEFPPDTPSTLSAIGVTWASHDPVRQQAAPFATATLGSCVGAAPPEVRRAAVHQAVQHLLPGGRLAVPADVWCAVAEICLEFGFTVATDVDLDLTDAGLVIARRSERLCVHDLLWEARAQISRVNAPDLAVELAGPDPPLVIDTRTPTDRGRTGVIAGSIHVPRTVVEWHLDPANGYRHPAVTGFDHPMVVVCNGGYSSSLAAANLQRIGFTKVRDLVGGVRAWVRQGLPVVAPDHAHLDL